MSSQQPPQLNIDRYVVTHVATTCDEHGVYVTKDSAEVIELGWILLDAKSLEEVCRQTLFIPFRLFWPAFRYSEPAPLTVLSVPIGCS